jgi:hypothetical protein
MRTARLLVTSALCVSSIAICTAQDGGQSAQAAGAPTQSGSTPLNPTQEVAGERPHGQAIAVGPAKLRVGGYLGLTGIHRSTDNGGGTGTKFASIAYADQLQGKVSETRLSAQSSRLSIRIDADFPESRPRFRSLSGYVETDFNGTAPDNVAVTSTSAGLRLRNAFAEVRYGETIYVSAGQAFSLMTPPKNQLSMWPSDLQLSQAIDTNYLAGLVWGRYPQLRVTWRPSPAFNWAASIENPEQQIGSSMVRLPSCCASDLEQQYNTGANQLNVPNLMPDIATRIAVRPVGALHVDAGGVLRVFRHTVAPYTDTAHAIGGGASLNANVEATRSTTIMANGAFGPGLGRYIGGLAPDVTFDRDGAIHLLPVTSWVAGIEQRIGDRASLAGYYSGVLIDRSVSVDADGSDIGYGFPGASRTNNRRIREVTATFSALTVTTDRRGSAQIGVQASWVMRDPWSPSPGSDSARAFLFFAQVRYNLP